jgi:hypothetical protein
MSDERDCPKCGGPMYDNRLTKKNPRGPDFRCKDRSCDGLVWPPREKKGGAPKPDPLTPEQVEAKRRELISLHAKCFRHVVENYAKLSAEHNIPPSLEGISALTFQIFKAQQEVR